MRYAGYANELKIERLLRLSGGPVARCKILTFSSTGIFAGLAAVLLTARIGAGTPRMGKSMLLDTIAAVVMDGTALSSSTGGPHCTILGVLITIDRSKVIVHK